MAYQQQSLPMLPQMMPVVQGTPPVYYLPNQQHLYHQQPVTLVALTPPMLHTLMAVLHHQAIGQAPLLSSHPQQPQEVASGVEFDRRSVGSEEDFSEGYEDEMTGEESLPSEYHQVESITEEKRHEWMEDIKVSAIATPATDPIITVMLFRPS